MLAQKKTTLLPPCRKKRQPTSNACQIFDDDIVHLPLSSSPLPYHPVRSRRWFFGCSCTAHCSQASALVRFSPPSLHRPVRWRLYSFPCSSIIQGFARTHACMHARAQQPLHTHRKMLMLVGRSRSSPLQSWGKEVASCNMQPCHAFFLFWSFSDRCNR